MKFQRKGIKIILLRCEACGASELKRHGNVYECAFCGSRYILDSRERVAIRELTDGEIISKLEQARRLHEARKYAEELGILIECHENDPKNASVLTTLGRCYRCVHEIDRAIMCYEEALKINPDEAAAYTNMGAIYIMRGEYDRAARCYEKGLPLHDKAEYDYWIAYANYALVIAMQGDKARAEKMIREAELHGYKNGEQLRKMAGIRKNGILSGIKALFS